MNLKKWKIKCHSSRCCHFSQKELGEKKLSSVSTADKSEIASTGTLEPDSNEPQPSVGHHKKFKSIPSLSRKNDLNCAFDISNYIAEGPDLDDATKINIIQN